MAESYIGEVRMFAGNFAPAGWALCDGQLLAISENEALFSLLGTTYGGDGQSTFALPDLRGRIPIHEGDGFVRGEAAGTEMVTLTADQMPSHTHTLLASASPGTSTNPEGNLTGDSASVGLYIEDPASAELSAQAMSSAGASQPHDNMQPFLCVNFIISLYGIFPSRT